jgi:uncharacterized membrane protein
LRHPHEQHRAARALGWVSIGLGLAEILAPRQIGRAVGNPCRPGVTRLMGLREIATGAGLLASRRPSEWLWARLAGDFLDLALVGAGARRNGNGHAGRRGAALIALAGVAALDAVCASRVSNDAVARVRSIRVRRAITVGRPLEEVYSTWRDLENLPRFMGHVRSVERTGDNRWLWSVKGPAGMTLKWEAEISEDQHHRLIAWKTLQGSDVDHRGSVTFRHAPGGRGTIVHVMLAYDPPAGRLGAVAARILGQSPEKQLRMDLLRFKQWMETGEIARTEGQPAGRKHSTSRKYDDWLRA